MGNKRVTNKIRTTLPWIAAEVVANIAYSICMIVIIGWLIPPEEFGAATAALAVVYIVETLSKAGIQEAIIREDSAHTLVTDVGHTTAVSLSLIGVAVVWMLALPVSQSLGDPHIAQYVVTASLILPLNSMIAAPLGILMRKLRAAQVMRRQLLAKLASLLVIGAGAYFGHGAWAIIASSITVAALSLCNIWFSMTRFPRFRWNTQVSGKLISFGFALSAENACWNIMSRAFALLFGFFHGVTELGALQFAFRLVDEIANLVRLAVSRVGLSAFASLKRSGVSLARPFENATSLIHAISAPMFAGLALLAPLLLPVLFGSEWQGAIPYVQIFALSWMVAMPRILVSPVLRILGKQYLQLAYAATSAIFALMASATVGQISPILGGVSYASRQLVTVPWGLWNIKQFLGISIGRQLLMQLPAYIATVLMVGSLWAIMHWLPGPYSLASLMVMIAAGASLYGVFTLIFNRSVLKLAVSLVKRR